MPLTAKQEAMDGRRSASPDHMNALETSDTSDSGPTVGEKTDSNDVPRSSTGRKVSLADAGEERNDSEAYPPRRRSRQGTRDTQRSEHPSLARRITDLFVSEHPVKHEPTWRASFMAIVKASWLNLLLVFIPIGWAVHFAHLNDTIVFIFNFLAIIPLAKLLGFGTEELAIRVGQALGGLLNATLGNAVELIVAIIALVKCEIQVVQSSLLGSILSNLLLVLGMCFFVGGIKYSEQGFKDTAAQLNSSLLVLVVFAILLPAGFNAAFQDNLTAEAEQARILKMSRGTSVILLVVYVGYLFFQLFTHQHLFAEGNTSEMDADMRDGRQIWRGHRAFRQAPSARRPRVIEEADENAEEAEEEVPQLNVWSALILLVGVTVLVAFTAEFLVSSINGLTEAHPEVSTEWVALILLPLVGNAAEHVTAVSVSVHDKIDLSMGVAVGSSIQIALFVIPLLVVLGWIMDKPLSLLFDPFESIILFLSVLSANYTMQDGRSNWLEGLILMMLYIIIAVSIWYYPSDGSAAFACN
ncbi:uncharacterized protein JCM15063_001286 [Sporobolomyces koalae]|uniref:uncharacterized protein n=1 Tax=Sporobolomyces koalae TaxID=500713 RepID=UPI00317E6173